MKKLHSYWDYLASNGQTYQMGAQSHRLYLLDLLTDKTVRSLLDVGCGTAPIYQLLEFDKIKPDAKWDVIEKYKGTDYSEGMIEVCKKEFPDGDFEVEDARALTEKDNSWDAVLLMHVLDHLDNYQAAIKEAARVSKKYVLIVLWRGIKYGTGAENNLNDRNMMGKEEGEEPWKDTHLQEYAWVKLQEAFKDAGLKVIKKVDGKVINKEGRYNTLILLQK